MRNNLKNVQYLLFVLFMFALTGCGASNLAGLGNGAPGNVTAKVVIEDGKSSAKSVGLPAGVTTIRFKVTGPYQTPGNTATRYTTTKASFPAAAGGGTVAVAPGTGLIVAVQALGADDTLLYESFKRDVIVSSGATTDLGTVTLTAPYVKTAEVPCLGCHEDSRAADGNNLVAEYKGSRHYSRTVSPSPSFNGMDYADSVGCAGCHTQNHKDLNPAESGRCANCHNAAGTPPNFVHAQPAGSATPNFGGLTNMCNMCHNPHTTALKTPNTDMAGCTNCHAVGQNAGTNYVQDNNGVRAITAEFTKWSHHVTGVALNDAHCAACHLEAKAVNGSIVLDTTVHMANATTHLRNADTDADFAWNPAAPNHSGMDTYCMSCHDANGATSAGSVAIQAVINAKGLAAAGKTASPSNPFGDTISNRYDKMQRPAVINVDGQFDVTNNSHHAVKGKRYSGRTRIEATRRIANPATFAANSSATLFGKRMTIYDAVTQDGRAAFNALYAPLGTAVPPTAATSLGDDSTLHCGDCHTVGQWKPGVATNAAGVLNTVAIGAHGSNNEYLLRNDKGTDERHSQDAYVTTAGVTYYQNPNAANLVCFNCHSYSRYGSVFSATGTTGPHAGEYDAQGRCNGVANTIPFNGYTTGTATDGTQFQSRFMGPVSKYAGTAAFAPGFPLNAANKPATGEQNPDFGNVFGIQCANCHNSGAGNAYGGIHGSKNNQTLTGYTNDPSVTGGSYIDGMGNTTKIMRFLPGLGDAMHVPGTLGGFTGGTVAKFIQYSSDRKTPPMFTELPVRDNRPAVNAKVGSYNFTTGGISKDANWEQKGWKQSGPNSTLDANQQQAVGAGCYTLGNSAEGTPGTITTGVGYKDQNGNVIAQRPNVMDDLKGPSQDGGKTTPELFDNWGGCDDHSAPKGGGNHGFIKRIVRPVTY